MDEIGCFIPDQHGSIVLHGITDSALDVNIITPQGIRRLSAFKFPTHPIPSMQIAAAYTASSRMELGVFSLRLGKKSAYEMFYVVDQQPLGQQGSCDVILGRTSAIHRILHPVNTGSHLAPVGVQQLTPGWSRSLGRSPFVCVDC
ncbi:hypothetical protein BJX96DRAFT_30236 [Aspergillus floccosus]